MPFSNRSRWPLWQTCLLVWALLWTPLWGQWHDQVHGLDLALPSLAASPPHADQVSDSDLSDHTAGSSLCHVLDHLALAERLTASAMAWTGLKGPLLAPCLRSALAWGHGRWPAAQARAPPLI